MTRAAPPPGDGVASLFASRTNRFLAKLRSLPRFGKQSEPTKCPNGVPGVGQITELASVILGESVLFFFPLLFLVPHQPERVRCVPQGGFHGFHHFFGRFRRRSQPL
jgi:hypothetical protein